MVFQFEHVALDQGASKWDVRPFRLRDLKASFGRWQAGLAATGWNSLYWNNHDQPRIVSRWGDDGAYRVPSATMLATVLHLHRGTPYVYQGEELGMRNMPFGSIADFRDIESLNHYAVAVARGEDPAARARRAAGDGPRQRPHPRAVGRLAARRVHDRHPVDRRQPRLPGGERGCAGRRPRLGLLALPPADLAAAHRAGRGARRLHDAAARRRRRVRVHPPVLRRPGRGRAAGAGQLHRREGGCRDRRMGRGGAGAGQLPRPCRHG